MTAALLTFTPACVEALYIARTGVQRRPTCVQLERMMQLMRILARVDRPGGFLWTWPKLARAMGFDVAGLGAKETKRRFQTRITNTMRYLVKAGLVDGWEVAYRGREPIGIIVTLPAGVAQSVRAARRPPRTRGEHAARSSRPAGASAAACSPGARGERAPGGAASVAPKAPGRPPGGQAHPFFDGQSWIPSQGGKGVNGNSAVGGSFNLSSSSRRTRAPGARSATRERAQLATGARAALACQLHFAGTGGGGAAIVDARPELAELPATVVARELAKLTGFLDAAGFRPVISTEREHQLEVAVAQLDRTSGRRGAGLAVLIDLLLGDWEQEWWRFGKRRRKPPQSLGAIAWCLRRIARHSVKSARARKRGRR